MASFGGGEGLAGEVTGVDLIDGDFAEAGDGVTAEGFVLVGGHGFKDRDTLQIPNTFVNGQLTMGY